MKTRCETCKFAGRCDKHPSDDRDCYSPITQRAECRHVWSGDAKSEEYCVRCGAARIVTVSVADYKLPLFGEVTGELLTTLCVDALTRSDDELRRVARAFIGLVRYHDARTVAQAGVTAIREVVQAAAERQLEDCRELLQRLR